MYLLKGSNSNVIDNIRKISESEKDHVFALLDAFLAKSKMQAGDIKVKKPNPMKDWALFGSIKEITNIYLENVKTTLSTNFFSTFSVTQNLWPLKN